MRRLITQNENNGIVYNAKGDLQPVTPGTIADFATAGGSAEATFVIESAGSWESVEQALNNTIASVWVSTLPTPPAWQGATNLQVPILALVLSQLTTVITTQQPGP